MDIHKNARLTFIRREQLAEYVILQGRTLNSAAAEFKVSARTAAKWTHRFRQKGPVGLIRECRSTLLDCIFGELSRKSGSSIEQVSGEIVASARIIRNALANAGETRYLPRGLFVLALQQVVDSSIVDLLTEDALEWLAEEQHRARLSFSSSAAVGFPVHPICLTSAPFMSPRERA